MFVTDNNSFDETTIDYLEYYFINKVKRSDYALENIEERNKEPNVNLFDKPKLVDFANQIEFLLSSNNISLDFFNEINESIKYFESSKNYNSKIFIHEGKFVMVKGSEIKRPIESSKEWQHDNLYERYNKKIDKYIDEGKVVVKNDKLILTVNIPFDSPTMPAVLSCGYSINGWKFFKGIEEMR